jgi:prepilin-type N-terminal cleavage/methylation domain-containing protein
MMSVRLQRAGVRGVVSKRAHAKQAALAAKRRKARGFTLIELLVVIAIIALLVALLMPVVRRAMELGNRVVCSGKMGVIGKACILYAADNDGWPPRECYIYSPWWSGHHEYPTYQGDAAPYWGGTPCHSAWWYGAPHQDPRVAEPWYFGCPGYRKGAAAIMECGMTTALNTRLCNFLGDTWIGGYVNFDTVDVPSEVVLAVEAVYAYQSGHFWGGIKAVCRGSIGRGGKVRMYPRHWAEGLNFVFLDGHRPFLEYDRRARKFLPNDPRVRP